MTLIQQFLITLILPLVLLFLIVYSWREAGGKEKEYVRYWLLALFVLALWASSILSFYVGVPFPEEASFFWRAAGRHALSLFALLLLLTTVTYLSLPYRQKRLLLGFSLGLWLLALVLDPAFIPYERALLAMGSQPLTPFMLWSGFWVAAWLVPLLAAWLVSWKAARQVPRSLYRNRINYWVLSLTLFLLGGSLALIQQPRQPLWQELSALVQILAAFTGARSLTHTELRDLRLTLRHLGARLASSFLVFGITWVVLGYVAYNIPRRTSANTSLDLIFAAGLFAALFMAVNQIGQRFIRQLLLPSSHSGELVLAQQPELTESLLHPDTLAALTLHLVQANLTTENAHLFLGDEGPAGSMILRPLATLDGDAAGLPLALAGDSPLNAHLRRTPPTPLFAYDVENLDTFATIPETEKEWMRQGQHRLLVGLPAGQQLVGLLALGDKYTGAPYNTVDAHWLQMLATQVGPLLWQARHLHNLTRLNNHTFDRLQTSTQERQYLQELSTLYAHFAQMASPELRGPLVALNQQIQQLPDGAEGINREALEHQLTQLRLMVDHLITTADRVQQQSAFVFDTIRLDDALNQAVRNLASMAEARRVAVQVETDPRLPSIQGDEKRLVEAIQYLLHNALKFNKIGGEVRIECAPAGNELFLHIHDTGVGIPEQRLAHIWTEFGYRHNGQSRATRPGLGLLLARFIVRAHGGRVEATSRYGAGSTFTIYLPLVLEQ